MSVQYYNYFNIHKSRTSFAQDQVAFVGDGLYIHGSYGKPLAS